MKTNVLLVDDHRILREGLRALLAREKDFTVVGEANDGRSAVQMVIERAPDVVVMDLSMPNLNGIEATRQIIAANPEVKVIGLSALGDERSTTEMLRAGARGYILKDVAFEELVAAIHTVMQNRVYLSSAVAGVVVSDHLHGKSSDRDGAYCALSPREREVLQLIAEGKSTKEVAASLSVSIKTAETHRRNLMEKLQRGSVAELTKYAIREGITSA